MSPAPRRDVVLRAAARCVYRTLLRAYPADFRREHGDDAARLFAEACVDGWREGGLPSLLRRVGRAVLDVPRFGLAERRPRPTVTRAGHVRRQPLRAVVDDIRFGIRSIVHRPAFSATIVATLALGIGANTAMFSVVDATLLRPLPYPDADRVVLLSVRSASGAIRAPMAAELLRWAPLVQAFERVEGRNWKPALITGETATEADLFRITAGYFDALRVRPIAGRLLHARDYEADAAPVAVLSERFWTARYDARPDVLGRAVAIDGVPHVITGVAPDLAPDAPGSRADVYTPLPSLGEAATRTHVRGIVWLKPGVSLAAAQDELAAISAAAGESGTPDVGVLARPGNIFWELREYRDSQLTLMIAVFLLLAIAGVNVANLLLAGGRARRAELAVRAALGAGRLRLVRLLLIESLLLSLGGCAAGVLVAWSAVRAFAALGYDGRWQTSLDAIRLDGVVLGYAIAMALVTGLAFGLVPALRSTQAAPSAILRDSDGRATSGRRRVRGALVAAEVALSVILLVVAGLVGRAFVQMRLADLGFDADRVVTIRLSLPWNRYPTPERRAAFFEQLRQEALRVPGITRAVSGTGVRLPSGIVINGEVDGGAGQTLEFNAGVTFTRAGYFDAMGIPLSAGRDFLDNEIRDVAVAAESAVIVSESFARRFWPALNPLGQELRLQYDGWRRMHVVGVARDVRGVDLLRPSCSSCRWHIYAPLVTDRLGSDLVLRVADGAPPPLILLRSAIRRLDPDVPIDEGLEMADARIYGTYLQAPRFRAAIFASLAALAVTLVGFGIAAVVAYSVSQRTREMGIRLALGARPSQVRRLILGEGLMPVIVGLGVGLGGAVLATRAIAHLLHGVSPTDPATFAIMSASLVAVAAGAIWLPALRATRVNPMRALRSE